MEKWTSFIQLHAQHAHWYIFFAALLAGLNIPISIDLLMIVSAILAAQIVPQHFISLFLSIFLGCLFSAWISYWIGRKLGSTLLRFSFFAKFFNEKRIEKMKEFYKRRGPLALLLGRFIPFGIRNCLYMSNGMSHVPFKKFVTWEALACGLWSFTSFSLYYLVGKNIDTLYSRVKIVNLLIFLAFSVTVIGVIWYKKRKMKKRENV